MKISLNLFGVAAIGLMVAACGGGSGGGSSDGGADTTVPTLGITSVQKVGATAIPNENVSAKPVFASNLLGKGWSFAPRQAFA